MIERWLILVGIILTLLTCMKNHNSLINNKHLNIRKVGKIILIQVGFFCFTLFCNAQKTVPSKPRIIVSTDIECFSTITRKRLQKDYIENDEPKEK